MNYSQSETGNILLSTMTPDDYALLEPHFERVDLPFGFQIQKARHKIDHVYFPEGGVVSIVAVTLNGRQCEVGLFGREGMWGTVVVMGGSRALHGAYVQVAGDSALRLRADALTEAMTRSDTMRLHLLKCAMAMSSQLSSSIVAAGQTIDQRLARWLLMFHDRVEGDTLALTQELIAMLLNVRRPGVSIAIRSLTDNHLINHRRAKIEVADRSGLERLAAGGYGLAEAEYERLLGVALRRARDG
jgi:CRP-like cAMP-binding protein